MNEPAREAADQLVRLTRLILRAGEPAVPEPDDGATRILRHNQATLTARETEVFGLIVAGHCNALLAELLDISERAMEQHLATLLAEFALPETRGERLAPATGPKSAGHGRIAALLIIPITGTVLIGGAAAAFALQSPVSSRAPSPEKAPPPTSHRRTAESAAASADTARAPRRKPHPSRSAPSPASASPSASASRRRSRLPSGTATATSFWDPATARGARMSHRTVASPYWPLGTRVRIVYRGHRVTGVVEDFGPADWAIAQHDVPAIVDLSEEMMAELTGMRAESVHVRFEVLSWGHGDVYRDSGPGYALAFGRDD
ncbi:LuxR C-terminal-related transcriptional regulator [Actinomadura oligospora]|uniref:LuxR C-terminal-related transcriptional regulator n=1 Tax=Actinomadura oligospora TaxID=111804 RepID=UPI000478FA9A|nr:LuxR C-terminal-related transcriptional regulator [Actinomadura oligospora]